LDQFGAQSRVGVFAQFLGKGVLPVESASLLLNLVLVVNCLEDTGAELCSHLAKDTIGFERLKNKTLQFVHFVSPRFKLINFNFNKMNVLDLSPPAFSMGKEMRLQPGRKDRDLNNVGPGSYTPDVKPK
jgi:hypothetical protein